MRREIGVRAALFRAHSSPDEDLVHFGAFLLLVFYRLKLRLPTADKMRDTQRKISFAGTK